MTIAAAFCTCGLCLDAASLKSACGLEPRSFFIPGHHQQWLDENKRKTRFWIFTNLANSIPLRGFALSLPLSNYSISRCRWIYRVNAGLGWNVFFQEQLQIVAGEEGALLQPGSCRPGKSIKIRAAREIRSYRSAIFKTSHRLVSQPCLAMALQN